MFEATRNKPIWFKVTLKSIPCKEKLDKLMNIKITGVKEFPEEMNTVKFLDCSWGWVKKLPKLPNCKELNCSNNELVRLPDLPMCSKLNCSGNLLVRLPDLPKCFQLDCSNNKLERFEIPPKCEWLTK